VVVLLLTLHISLTGFDEFIRKMKQRFAKQKNKDNSRRRRTIELKDARFLFSFIVGF